MSTRRRRCARSTGVSLEIAVLEYLRELADRSERDRSFCINQIVREHAERHGRVLPMEVEGASNQPARER
ncbi:MAG: hypothetical protein AB7O66_14630 [Limisphaerales bacterium]